MYSAMDKKEIENMAKELKFSFNTPNERVKYPYEDTFTEEIPDMESLKTQKGTVVWCDYIDCINNKEAEGVRRTTGSILKNVAYNPLNEQEHIWTRVCGRDEIAIQFKRSVSPSGGTFKVPACFTASTKVKGHLDFAKLLQSDGTPYGGSIESQNPSY